MSSSQFLSEENVERLRRAALRYFPHAPTAAAVRSAQSEALWLYGTAYHQGSWGLLPGPGYQQSFSDDCEELNRHTLDILYRNLEGERRHENWHHYMLTTPVGDRLVERPQLGRGTKKLYESSARLLP